ncbi:MFS transporter [Brenneria izadpanahii]|uniref:MFS transporter n=1 Tax=Brenneria izadpanahii TaxID=2722756 RepID=A0ABX7UP03_9GAMM|nr:MFS transporter [Brenneria izadpanahii]QTF06990.1 MFS transporter [Brenneria izadpanahii]
MSSFCIVFLVGFAGFISAADNWVASLLLPDISSSFDTNISQASVILTAYLIPYGIMQPVYGYYSDIYNRKKILQILMFLLGVATLLCSIAGSILSLTIFRFIAGFFAAGIISVSLGILGQFFEKDTLTKLVGIFLGFIFLGQGISSGIGGWLIEISSWRKIFLIFSALSFISFLLIFKLPSKSAQGKINALLPSIFSLLKDSHLLQIYFLAFCNGFGVLGGYSFIGSYLSKSLNIGYLYVGFGLMLFGLICFITGLVNRTLSGKLPQKQILPAGFICSLCSLLLLASHNIYLTYIAIILLGMGYVLVQSILASRALDLAGGNKGLSSGLIGVGIFGGGGIGTWLGSMILNIGGYINLFLFFAGLIIIPLLVLSFSRKNWLVS